MGTPLLRGDFRFAASVGAIGGDQSNVVFDFVNQYQNWAA